MIAALLLAAGESLRMGRPKMTLPWGEGQTLIGHMVELFRGAGLDLVVVVTGGDRELVEAALADQAAELVHNPGYRSGEMISSVQMGLSHLQASACDAAMITPADLPHLFPATIRALIDAWEHTESGVLAPSHSGRRGHPMVIARELWTEILQLGVGETLRDFLSRKSDRIRYLEVKDPGVTRDLDTPEDYRQAQNGSKEGEG